MQDLCLLLRYHYSDRGREKKDFWFASVERLFANVSSDGAYICAGVKPSTAYSRNKYFCVHFDVLLRTSAIISCRCLFYAAHRRRSVADVPYCGVVMRPLELE